MLCVILTYNSNHNLLYFLGISQGTGKGNQFLPASHKCPGFLSLLKYCPKPFSFIIHLWNRVNHFPKDTLKWLTFAKMGSSTYCVLIWGPERLDMHSSNYFRSIPVYLSVFTPSPSCIQISKRQKCSNQYIVSVKINKLKLSSTIRKISMNIIYRALSPGDRCSLFLYSKLILLMSVPEKAFKLY